MRIAGCDAIIIFVILKYFIYSFSRWGGSGSGLSLTF
jgi:hypothetical protein